MAHLSDLVEGNIERFHTLLKKHKNSESALSESLLHTYERFWSWSRSSGASQHYDLPTSLESTLKTAVYLLDVIRSGLNDLQEDLDDIIKASNETTNDLAQDGPATASTALEDDMSLHLKDLALELSKDGLSITPEDLALELSKINRTLSPEDLALELSKAAAEDVTGLFKYSTFIRKATTRDRYAWALARVSSDEVLSEEAEAEAIGDHFPTLRSPQLQWLRLRLSQANNTRRRFLKYCEMHTEAAVGSDESTQPFKGDLWRQPMDVQLHSSEREADCSTISNQTLTLTAGGTRFGALEHTAERESPLSSTAQTGSETVLSVPPLETASQGSEVFICPYCRSEQAITTQEAWRQHVFADLRAYVCTHKSCEMRMFEGRDAWLKHEVSEHFVVRQCPCCEDHKTFSTDQDLQSHLTQMHRSRFKDEQLPLLLRISMVHPCQVSPSACHFCDWETKLRWNDTPAFSGADALVSVRRYKRHVGSHLEQAALLVIASVISSADDRSDDENNDSGVSIKLAQFGGPKFAVLSVAFSPDGQILASVSDDRTVRLWDVTKKRQIERFIHSRNRVSKVVFSPDGQLLALASDGSVHLREVATGASVMQLKDHRYPNFNVLSVAFSPNGQMVASGSNDQKVRLWDVATGAFLGALEGHGLKVLDVAFSHDGRLVASASDDRTVRLWDVATMSEIQQLLGHQDCVKGIAFSPGGQLIASASSDKTVRIWDVATGAQVKRIQNHLYSCRNIAFSPDGRLLALASSDSTLRLWDVEVGAEFKQLKGHKASIKDVAFSPDGRLLASASSDSTVQLWNCEKLALKRQSEGRSKTSSSSGK